MSGWLFQIRNWDKGGIIIKWISKMQHMLHMQMEHEERVKQEEAQAKAEEEKQKKKLQDEEERLRRRETDAAIVIQSWFRARIERRKFVQLRRVVVFAQLRTRFLLRVRGERRERAACVLHSGAS